MKAFEQYFNVVLFIMPYKVVLTLKSVGETLVCDHSNESYWAVLYYGRFLFFNILGSKSLHLATFRNNKHNQFWSYE